MKFNNSIISKFNSKATIQYLALLLILFLSLNLSISCDTTEQQSKVKILLEAEDASCTEAWLNLKIESTALPIEISLFQGDSLLFTTNINSSDTTLFVENLLPNQNYSFYSTIAQFNNGTIKSNSITVTTMDTTSHNFSWKTFEFGNYNSYLNDVAIINENNIWAVGEIHTAETDQFDSNGVWVQPYNAVHWDGTNWELKRIMFPTDADQPDGHKSAKECNSIFLFNENDFVVSASVQVAFMNSANSYIIKKMDFKWEDRFTISSIWGTTSQDFYVVGNGGNIAHYNGSSWTKIESGTELNFYDIYGKYNTKTNMHEIIAVASHIAQSKEREIVKIENNTVKPLSSEPIAWSISSLWFVPNRKYYIGGSGIYIKNLLENSNWNSDLNNITNYYVTDILGIGLNNIFIVGACGIVFHFNGTTWKEEQPINCLQGYGNVSMKDNIVVIAGNNGVNGLLLFGRR
jgi:hypothetical protein